MGKKLAEASEPGGNESGFEGRLRAIQQNAWAIAGTVSVLALVLREIAKDLRELFDFLIH